MRKLIKLVEWDDDYGDDDLASRRWADVEGRNRSFKGRYLVVKGGSNAGFVGKIDSFFYDDYDDPNDQLCVAYDIVGGKDVYGVPGNVGDKKWAYREDVMILKPEAVHKYVSIK